MQFVCFGSSPGRGTCATSGFRSHKSVQINCSNMSDQLLYAWGRDFVAEVLSAMPWGDRWTFEFRMPDANEKDPYVVFY